MRRRDPWAHPDGSEHSASGPLGCMRCAAFRRGVLDAYAGRGAVTAANKKPPVLAGNGVAARLLDDMPKAMRADLVADMLRATHGEDISDVALAERIAEAARPVARVRGWRVPRWWREFLVPEGR